MQIICKNRPEEAGIGRRNSVSLDLLSLDSIYLVSSEDEDTAVDEDENVKFWQIGSKK